MTKRRKRRFFGRIILATTVVVLGILISITYYLLSNDPPILEGRVIYDQPYKGDLTLDVYLPTKIVYESSPVVIFYHGGAWIAGMKESINFNRFNGAINTLRNQGYVVIAPEYTLASKEQPPFPYCIQDAFSVVEWVEANADKYNFDLDNLGLFGESAGAHIAMMVAYAPPGDFSLDFPKHKFNYVVDVYGPSELHSLYLSTKTDSMNQFIGNLPEALRQHLNLEDRLFGFDPEADSTKTMTYIKKYSPVTYLAPKSPPTLLIHGTDDQLVPYNQSIILRDLLSEQKVPHEFHAVEGSNHGFIGASKEQKDSIQVWISEFISKYYQ